MRAVTVNAFGELPRVAEICRPLAGPGQVLIELAAASFNPMDAKLASGEWRPFPATFPMVLGVDGAGAVVAVGEGTTRFSPGDRVFGQFFMPPIGASGTYAEYVAVTADAPMARVPTGLALDVAAASPTVGTAGLSLIDLLEPVAGQVILIVGAGGGVGTFSTQFAINAGASAIVNINAGAEARMRSYGVEETIIRSQESVGEAVRRSHPNGVDALIDLVSDATAFASMTSLVCTGGTAITTQYVADLQTLQSRRIRGVNFNLAQSQSSELLERVGKSLVDHIVTVPPITHVGIDDVPALFEDQVQPNADGKTVIIL